MSRRQERPLTNRQKKMMKRRKKRRKIMIIELLILAALLLVLFVGLKVEMIDFSDLTAKTNKLDAETQKLMEGYTTIAVFGVDNRTNGNYETGNSDSIILANINNETKEVKLVSVYRDTCMEVNGEGKLRKCNYAYDHGGVDTAVDMLNRNLDLDIDGYVAIDFYALVDAVDAVGGIEIEVTDEEAAVMNASYIHFVEEVVGKKSQEVSGGLQTLDGIQTLSYCRIRYTKGDDFRRTERQRVVLEKLVDKVKNMSLSQMNKLADSVFPNIKTSFKLSQILSMASVMRDYELTEKTGFPFSLNTARVNGGQDTVFACTLESNVKQLHQYLFAEEDYTPSEELRSISNALTELSGLREEDGYATGY